MRRPPANTLHVNSLAARRRNPSVCVVAWAVTHSEVSHPAVRALLVLAQHMDGHGRAFPGLDRIARLGGMSRRTVQRAVDALVKHPAAPITRKQRHNTSSVYVLTTPAYDAPAAANRMLKGLHGESPDGVAPGAPEGAIRDTSEAPNRAPSLGVTSGALTLRNLGGCHRPASAHSTNNGNGALKREGTHTLAEISPSRVPTPAREMPPRARTDACDETGCHRPAMIAAGGAMFCEMHAPLQAGWR